MIKQCLNPFNLKKWLSLKERELESLIFLLDKWETGSTQREYIMKEEEAIPTAATEAILITGVIEAKQRRYIMTLDIPNAFVQTSIPQDGDKVMMKIRGPLVNILCEICPGVYDNVVIK